MATQPACSATSHPSSRLSVYLPVAQPVSDDEDPELAEYNRYLASLNQKDPAT